MDASLIVSSFDRFMLPAPIVTVDGPSTIIWLAGEQDSGVVEALNAALVEALSSPVTEPSEVIVDLRGVTFIDSSTAGALIDATLRQPGSWLTLTLRAPSACVRRMFVMCGRSDLLDIA